MFRDWLWLKNCGLSIRARIVMLTGYASIATAVEAIKLGATHYLAKPVDVDEIMIAFERTSGDADVKISAHIRYRWAGWSGSTSSGC